MPTDPMRISSSPLNIQSVKQAKAPIMSVVFVRMALGESKGGRWLGVAFCGAQRFYSVNRDTTQRLKAGCRQTNCASQ